MSKPVKLAAVVVAVALAVPVSSWWIGRNIEQTLNQQYKQLEMYPYFEIVNHQYQRGIFSANHVLTIGLSKEWLETLDMGGQDLSLADDLSGLTITQRSDIQHGPFPGWSYFGAGEAKISLEFSEPIKSALTKVYGDKSPFESHVVFDFDGGSKFSFRNPGFEYSANEPDLNGKVVWKGFEGTGRYNRNMSESSVNVTMPGFSIQDDKGGELILSGGKLEGRQVRPFEDDPLFYIGSSKLHFAEFTARNLDISDEYGDPMLAEPITFTNINYEIDMPLVGDKVNVEFRLNTETARVGEQDYGPIRFDQSLLNLDARALAKLYSKLAEAYQTKEGRRLLQDNPEQLFAPLAEQAQALLAGNPELRFNEISFNSPFGRTDLKGHARLNGLTLEDFNQPPFLLLEKLDASTEVSLPYELLLKFATARADDEEEALFYTMQFEEQLSALEAKGFLTRSEKTVSTRAAFKNGELTVMDKPFNPLMLD